MDVRTFLDVVRDEPGRISTAPFSERFLCALPIYITSKVGRRARRAGYQKCQCVAVLAHARRWRISVTITWHIRRRSQE